MRNYTELLTEREVSDIISSYLQTDNADPSKVKDILDLLSFYMECKIIADGILSGALEVTGLDENGLRYRASNKELRKLH